MTWWQEDQHFLCLWTDLTVWSMMSNSQVQYRCWFRRYYEYVDYTWIMSLSTLWVPRSRMEFQCLLSQYAASEKNQSTFTECSVLVQEFLLVLCRVNISRMSSFWKKKPMYYHQDISWIFCRKAVWRIRMGVTSNRQSLPLAERSTPWCDAAPSPVCRSK